MPGGVAHRRSAARDAATAVEIVASRASRRRSAVLTAAKPTGSVGGQARPDTEVAAGVFLEMHIPEHALEPVAGAFGNADRRLVLDVDSQLDADEAELVEGPPGQELDRARRDPAASGRGRDEVADLGLAAVEVGR